jgi:hypothetical protein
MIDVRKLASEKESRTETADRDRDETAFHEELNRDRLASAVNRNIQDMLAGLNQTPHCEIPQITLEQRPLFRDVASESEKSETALKRRIELEKRSSEMNRSGHKGVFASGYNWGPPQGADWGWHDQTRFNQGWDAWFFAQSPNYELWRQEIALEARNIGILLDTGNGMLAARRLQADLIRLRPDRYAQNELIFQVNQMDRKGFGSDLVLGRWNPLLGGWEQGYIVQSPFRRGPVYPVYY